MRVAFSCPHHEVFARLCCTQIPIYHPLPAPPASPTLPRHHPACPTRLTLTAPPCLITLPAPPASPWLPHPALSPCLPHQPHPGCPPRLTPPCLTTTLPAPPAPPPPLSPHSHARSSKGLIEGGIKQSGKSVRLYGFRLALRNN